MPQESALKVHPNTVRFCILRHRQYRREYASHCALGHSKHLRESPPLLRLYRGCNPGHSRDRESAVKAMLLCVAIYSFFQVLPFFICWIAEVAFQDGAASVIDSIHI